jgi:hypothetical protein
MTLVLAVDVLEALAFEAPAAEDVEFVAALAAPD